MLSCMFGDLFMKLTERNKTFRIFFAKNKCFVVFERPARTANFVINNEPIEYVSEYKYLGTWVSDKWDQK